MGYLSKNQNSILLIGACIIFAASFLVRPPTPDPQPFVSFNDGTLECENYYVQPNVSREVMASQLRAGAEALIDKGCVNYSFEGEDE